jgi:hypothetical protein
MKNLTTKKLLAASAATLIGFNTFAVDDVPNTTVVTFNHPQSISISDPADAAITASADTSSTVWTINSNNAVKVVFSGKSYDVDGTAILVPILAKQESDAKDLLIAKQYDQLVTLYGLEISGHHSVENGTNSIWQGGSSAPAGTPTNLVGGAETSATNSATNHFGAIMPSDTGTFTLKLSTLGTGDVSATQSGDYTATVTTTIIADEQTGAASN